MSLNIYKMEPFLKVLSDIPKGRIKIREKHINELLSNNDKIKKIINAEVEVKDDFFNLKGQAEIKQFFINFNQSVSLIDHIDMKNKVIKVDFRNAENQSRSSDRNIIQVRLEEFKRLEKYIDRARGINIIKDLSIDEIQLCEGHLKLVSKDRLELILREEFIQDIINEELVNSEEMIKSLKIKIMNDYFLLQAIIKTPEFTIEVNKSISVNKFDLMDNRIIELEIHDNNALLDYDQNLKDISLILNTDRLGKISDYMEHKMIKPFISKFILTKNHSIKCVQEEHAIVIYPK